MALTRTWGLKAKVIVLVIVIVSTVLLASTSIGVRAVQTTLEEDVKERGLLVARSLAAGIRSARDLDDPRPLEREVQAIMRSRGSIQTVAIFVLRSVGLTPVVTSDGPAGRRLQGIAGRALNPGSTVEELRVNEDVRAWEVAVPIQLGKRVLGAVAVEVSLERADLLATRQRRQALEIMGISALVIIGVLGVYLHRLVNRPIAALASAMSRAEAGDLDARAAIAGRDELGQLAQHYNQMVDRVANFNERLRLEVEAATRELATRYEELRRLNERLFDLQRELTRSNRLAAVGQLAAMVTHDVATPLHSISGHVQLLLAEDGKGDKALYRLRIIESQIARVVEILERLLSASRPDRRAVAPVSLNAVVSDLLDLTAPALDQKGVQLALDLDPALPAVRADPTSLQQVCLNLLLNAIDAMPDGGRLTVVTGRARPDDLAAPGPSPATAGSADPGGPGLVELTLSDTGSGISPEHLVRIFDPFFTTKEPGQGTGLGLAICDRIVKAYGGTIAVSSETGKGSAFTVRLPAEPRTSPQPSGGSDDAPPSPDAGPPRPPGTHA